MKRIGAAPPTARKMYENVLTGRPAIVGTAINNGVCFDDDDDDDDDDDIFGRLSGDVDGEKSTERDVIERGSEPVLLVVSRAPLSFITNSVVTAVVLVVNVVEVVVAVVALLSIVDHCSYLSPLPQHKVHGMFYVLLPTITTSWPRVQVYTGDIASLLPTSIGTYTLVDTLLNTWPHKTQIDTELRPGNLGNRFVAIDNSMTGVRFRTS